MDAKVNKEQAKAIELIHKFMPTSRDWNIEKHALFNAKENATMCVEQIIIAFESELFDLFSTARNCPINQKHSKFWIAVKEEIKKYTPEYGFINTSDLDKRKPLG